MVFTMRFERVSLDSNPTPDRACRMRHLAKGTEMARLTQANYTSRRQNLTDLLVAAQETFTEAAIRREVDDGSTEPVEAAKQEVDRLQTRIDALDAAWERAQEEERSDREAARVAKRGKVAENVHAMLKQRHDAAQTVDRARQLLIDSWETLRDINRRIGETAGAWINESTLDLVLGSLNLDAEHRLIAGELRNGGLKSTGDMWMSDAARRESFLDAIRANSDTALLGLTRGGLPELGEMEAIGSPLPVPTAQQLGKGKSSDPSDFYCHATPMRKPSEVLDFDVAIGASAVDGEAA